MSELARFKLNLKTGEIEIEGSEAFVEKQIESLSTLVELISAAGDTIAANDESTNSNKDEITPPNSAQTSNNKMPDTFGEWLQSFKSDANDLEKALLTARYVQSQSATNDFKTSEVNKSLKDHGIKLTNSSSSLKRLIDKKYLFQTRKVGKLAFMRVSVDGQKHLDSIKFKG